MSEHPIERLFQCLDTLGHSVEVRVSPEEVRPENANLTLVMA